MARMRSLKPEFWEDEELACNLSRDARLLYIGLWNLADEHARLRGDPRHIKGKLLPYDDDISPADVDALLDALVKMEKVVRYEVRGSKYLFLPNLARHQRLEADKVPSRLPGPDESESRMDSFARDSNKSEPGADVLPLKHVACGSEHVAGGRGSRGAARDVPPTILGSSLLDEHIKSCNATPPRSVVGSLGERIDQLLDEGQDPENIRRGLAALRLKTNLGPGALPSLINEILQGGSPDKPQRPRRSSSHIPYQDPPNDSVYEGKIQ